MAPTFGKLCLSAFRRSWPFLNSTSGSRVIPRRAEASRHNMTSRLTEVVRVRTRQGSTPKSLHVKTPFTRWDSPGRAGHLKQCPTTRKCVFPSTVLSSLGVQTVKRICFACADTADLAPFVKVRDAEVIDSQCLVASDHQTMLFFFRPSVGTEDINLRAAAVPDASCSAQRRQLQWKGRAICSLRFQQL